MYAYIGCRTTKERNARGKGISVYKIEDNAWKLLQIRDAGKNPSYLCLNEAQDRLYSIQDDFSEVSSYAINTDGTLTFLNRVGTHGTNPVHLSLDKTGKWLFVANLQTGAVSVIPVKEDGSLDRIKELYFVSGNGGPGYISHPHQTGQDRTGQWLLIPTQGRLQGVGKITTYKIDSENGILEETSMVKGRSGSEPRHVVFHPNNRFCYCVNEKDSTIALYYFDVENGSLEPKQILTSLPEDYSGDGWASAIDIEPNGKAVYLSNRKHDSITVYTIDQDTGRLNMIQNIKTQGEQPRFITVSPDGKQLLAANELTDSIAFFEIKEDGSISGPNQLLKSESPVCIVYKTK